MGNMSILGNVQGLDLWVNPARFSLQAETRPIHFVFQYSRHSREPHPVVVAKRRGSRINHRGGENHGHYQHASNA